MAVTVPFFPEILLTVYKQNGKNTTTLSNNEVPILHDVGKQLVKANLIAGAPS
jgi:hypothetical protein